jgi:chorismate dehydratase
MLVGPPPVEPRVDVGLISIIDAAQTAVPLTLIPAGMIGCDGPTLTVRLFSRVPFDRVETLHADTDSHTSVNLARVLLARKFGCRPRLVAYDARERVAADPASGRPAAVDLDEAWPETLLLIGDKVVTDSPPAVRYPYQLDLGEAWKELTGLPFAYAVWACRRDDRDTPGIASAAAVLDRQRRRNTHRLDWIIARRAAEKNWPGDLARTYVGSLLRFEVTAAVREAAQLFVDLAAEEGLVPRTALDWYRGPGIGTALGSDALPGA